MLKRIKTMSKRDNKHILSNLGRLIQAASESNHFRIHHCYDIRVQQDWHIETRTIEDWHLLFVKGGKGWYKVDGEYVKLERGKVIFVSSEITYEAGQDFDYPPEIMPIRFCVYNNQTGKASPEIIEPFWFEFTVNNVSYWQRMFEELHWWHLKNNNGDNIGSVSAQILAVLNGAYAKLSRTSSSGDIRIQQVIAFLNTHPLDRSSIGELASKAGLTSKYFTKLFKISTGLSPKSYQLKGRLNYGRFLLETGKSVKETADILGYPDQYIFSKQFKNNFDISPSRLKQNKTIQ
jgi:AraC-like DNA-binding protein